MVGGHGRKWRLVAVASGGGFRHFVAKRTWRRKILPNSQRVETVRKKEVKTRKFQTRIGLCCVVGLLFVFTLYAYKERNTSRKNIFIYYFPCLAR